jgi:hypothetical protein
MTEDGDFMPEPEVESMDVEPNESHTWRKLGDNVNQLLAILGQDNNSLRAPIMKILASGLTTAETQLVFGNGPNLSTILRYRTARLTEGDILRLHGRGAMPKFGGTGKVIRKRKTAEMASAAFFVSETAGKTKSGRIRTVNKTSRTRHGFFEQYQRESKPPHVSETTFLQICNKMRVHFLVGGTDFMTCTKCREFETEITRLEGLSLDASSLRQNVQEKIKSVKHQKEIHVGNFLEQRKVYNYQLENVRGNGKEMVLIIDYSTFELMARGKTKVMNATVISQGPNNTLVRMYYDLVGLPISGRPCDGFGYMLLFLNNMCVFAQTTKLHIWSDAGSGDFRNNSTLCWMRDLVCKELKFLELVDMNFFGQLHGWSDSDRHFGAGKQHEEKFMRESASDNPSIFLDVPRLVRLLCDLKNTHALDCREMVVPGISVTQKLKGIKSYLYFRANNMGEVLARARSGDTKEVQVVVEGMRVSAQQASAAALKRKIARKPVAQAK